METIFTWVMTMSGTHIHAGQSHWTHGDLGHLSMQVDTFADRRTPAYTLNYTPS